MREVLAKVALGEVDAGFVYSTDAKTVAKKVLVIKIPAWAQPKVQYGICVVSSSSHKSAAKAFVKQRAEQGRPEEAAQVRLPRARQEVGRRRMKRGIGVGLFVAVAVVTLAFLALPIVGIFVHTSPGKLLDQLSNPGRQGRVRRQRQDERDRAGADPALRHADRLPARDAPLPRPLARGHARRVAARAPAGGRRDRAARGARPRRHARLEPARVRRLASRSPRPRSRSRLRMSPARSTSGRRSPRSRRPIRT